MTRDNTIKWVVNGTWDDHIEAARVVSTRNSNKGTPVIETEPPTPLWKRRIPPYVHQLAIVRFVVVAVID